MEQKLELNYTSDMEKAMQQAHGVNFSEYEMNADKRLEVEMQREKQYKEGLEISSEMEKDVNR